VSIAATYIVLRWRLRDQIGAEFPEVPKRMALPRGA
jgi:hypothetical protein